MFRPIGAYSQVVAHWAMELVIVVAGVLIALSAQQWAQVQSSKQRAGDAEERIRLELTSNVLTGVERIALGKCLRGQLAKLADGLRSDRSSWTDLQLAEPGLLRLVFSRMYRTPDRPWPTTEYQGSLSNGSLESVPAERTGLLASAYAQIRSMQSNNEEELRLAAELGVLQFGQPLAASDRNRLLSILVRLDQLNATMILIAEQQIEGFNALKYEVPREILNQARQERYWPNHVATMRSIYGSCVDGDAIAKFDRRLLQ